MLKLIPRGAAIKRTSTEIGSIIGLEKRKVQYAVNRLIKKSNPIVAKRNGKDRGYYVATTPTELAEGLEALKKQQRETEVCIQLVQQIDLDQWKRSIPMKNSVPVLLGFNRSKSDNSLMVWCPYCSEWHNHGNEQGHVIAHCTKNQSPFKETGYRIKKVTKTDMKKIVHFND